MYGIQCSKHLFKSTRNNAVDRRLRCDRNRNNSLHAEKVLAAFSAITLDSYHDQAKFNMVADNEEKLAKILKEKFTSSFRKGYINVDGVTMPDRYLDIKNDIDNWDVKDTDIWVCSFPKTGTTWTQEMVWMIMNELDFKGAKVNIGARFPFLEVSALFDYRQLMSENEAFRPPPFLTDSIEFVKNQSDPKFIKTHLPWNLLPKQIQDEVKHPRIIYVARNPKDTCISYYHHSKLLEGFKGDFDEFCDLFLAGKLNFAPYWNHVIDFWERRKKPNILFITYEDMKKDLPAVARKVTEFLNKELTDKEIKVLSDHLSFESMKANDAVNYEMVVDLNRKFKLIEHNGTFMRCGTVGNYKTVMSPALIERFDKWTEKQTKETSLNFYKN